MKKFEYRVEMPQGFFNGRSDLERYFNQMGESGWELVSERSTLSENIFTWKRLLPEFTNPSPVSVPNDSNTVQTSHEH